MSNKTLSRQRLWQIEQQKKGLCYCCKEKAIPPSRFCAKHLKVMQCNMKNMKLRIAFNALSLSDWYASSNEEIAYKLGCCKQTVLNHRRRLMIKHRQHATR